MNSPIKFLLVGKPNSGKTLLFNRLTGLNQKVANFPGVTVEVKTGNFEGIEILDLPGIYSLKAVSTDEEVAIEQLYSAIEREQEPVLLCVLDATRLERSLVLGLQMIELATTRHIPLIFLLNMADELKKHRISIDAQALEKELGFEVHLLSARTLEGVDSLRIRLRSREFARSYPQIILPRAEDASVRAKAIADRFAPSSQLLLHQQTRLDRFALHDALGLVIFLLSMAVMFQAVFTWAAPIMDAIGSGLEIAGLAIAERMPYPIIGDFLKDAVLGGISAVIVFVPQITLLTFMIGLMEDSGYLARAAILCHRGLSFFGLSGKSFVPLLSGHACAIPAIMASRTIESPKARWLTLLAIPLMSCSARLPVYALLISAVIPDVRYLGGLVGLRGLCMLLLYLFGILSGLFVASIVNRYSRPKFKESIPLILELPSYRLPSWKPLIIRSFGASWQFIKRAGATVFFVSLIVWILGYFPDGANHLDSSYLASAGKLLSPLFAPIDIDWKVTVAILSSFLAREVFVGTLGVLFGIENAADRVNDLSGALQNSGLSLASGIALLIFFALSLQCVSTLSVLKKETGSTKLPVCMFMIYLAAAYSLSLVAFLIVTLVS